MQDDPSRPQPGREADPPKPPTASRLDAHDEGPAPRDTQPPTDETASALADRIPRRGLGALADDEFSLRDAIGGWRGLIESIAPGAVFVVVFVWSRSLPASLIASVAVAGIAVVARLIGRTPITQALSGLGGVVIGVVWAALSGRAQDYFAGGFIANLVIFAVALGSIVARWPAVGVIYGLVSGKSGWRDAQATRRAATWATWPWVVLPVVRIAVQWPLFIDGARAVGWLGTARLAMGLPLTALAVYLSWWLMRRATAAGAAPAQTPPR